MSKRLNYLVVVMTTMGILPSFDVATEHHTIQIALANTGDTTSAKSKKGIDVRKYFEMSDPKKAAAELLADARSKNIDIDFTPPNPLTPKGVGLPSGPIIPKDKGQDFLQKVNSDSLPEIANNSEIMCVFQLTRQISCREIATIMSLGIKIYDTLSGFCYVARVPKDQVARVLALPTVGWIDAYLPEYKYRSESVTDEFQPFEIVSLIGRSQSCDVDLKRLGVECRFSRRKVYQALLSTANIHQVAELWWVKEIYRAPRVITR